MPSSLRLRPPAAAAAAWVLARASFTGVTTRVCVLPVPTGVRSGPSSTSRQSTDAKVASRLQVTSGGSVVVVVGGPVEVEVEEVVVDG